MIWGLMVGVSGCTHPRSISNCRLYLELRTASEIPKKTLPKRRIYAMDPFNDDPICIGEREALGPLLEDPAPRRSSPEASNPFHDGVLLGRR